MTDKLEWLLGEATDAEIRHSIPLMFGLVGLVLGIYAAKPLLLRWADYSFVRWGRTDQIIVPWLLCGWAGLAVGIALGIFCDRNAPRPIRVLACRCRQLLTLAVSIIVVIWSAYGLIESRMPSLFYVIPGIVFLAVGVSVLKPLARKFRSFVAT